MSLVFILHHSPFTHPPSPALTFTEEKQPNRKGALELNRQSYASMLEMGVAKHQSYRVHVKDVKVLSVRRGLTFT